MSSTYATPLRLDLRRPRGWLAGLVALHGMCLATLLLLPMPWPWRLGLFLLWLVAAVQGLRQQCTGRVVTALWQEQDGWRLWFADGRVSNAWLLPGYFQRGPLLQLKLRVERGRPITLTILPGMLPAESLRRLKVRLRLTSVPPANASLRD